MTVEVGDLSDGQEKDEENKKSGGPGWYLLKEQMDFVLLISSSCIQTCFNYGLENLNFEFKFVNIYSALVFILFLWGG